MKETRKLECCENCKIFYNKQREKQLIALSVFVGLLIVVTIFMFFMPYTSEKFKASVNEFVYNEYYDEISERFENDTIIQSVAYLCSQFEDKEEQLVCVNDFAKRFFYYDSSTINLKIVRYPYEVINYGGCCRDYSVFYNSILNVMGFETEYIFESTHMYVIIYSEGNVYALDQEMLILLDENDMKKLNLPTIHVEDLEAEELYLPIDEITAYPLDEGEMLQ